MFPDDLSGPLIFVPELQREDGSYIGSDRGLDYVMAMGSGGGILWQYQTGSGLTQDVAARPLYATADGGVIFTTTPKNCAPGDITLTTLLTPDCISQDGALPGSPNFGQLGTIYTLDQNGNPAVDANGNPIPAVPDTGAQMSWLGNWYVDPMGSVSLTSGRILDLALSFTSVFKGNPSNAVAVRLRSARAFVPYGLYRQPTCDGNGCSAPVINSQDSTWKKKALAAVKPWESIMDIRIPRDGHTGLSDFLPLATANAADVPQNTNEIVAYLGHGIGQPDFPNSNSFASISMGLLFPESQCLWFKNLQPQPLQGGASWEFSCQNSVLTSNVTQKPKIIFLGMCGVTGPLVNDWTLDSGSQVLIYPAYNSKNTSREIPIGLAANEYLAFLSDLIKGNTVQHALNFANTIAQQDISQAQLPTAQQWTWTSYGNTNLTFTKSQ